MANLWIKSYEEINLANQKEFTDLVLYEYLDRLIQNNFRKALLVIFYIFENSKNEFVLNNLSAGPLEDLLVYHGVEVIEDIESYTFKNKSFRGLLKHNKKHYFLILFIVFF